MYIQSVEKRSRPALVLGANETTIGATVLVGSFTQSEWINGRDQLLSTLPSKLSPIQFG